MQVGRAAAGHLHRHVRAMARLDMAGGDTQRPMGAADALFTVQHEERLGAGVAVDGRDGAGRAAGVVDAEQVLRRLDAGDGADFGDLDRAGRRGAGGAEGEEPGLAGGVGDEGPGAGEDVGLRVVRDGLDAPVEVAGGRSGTRYSARGLMTRADWARAGANGSDVQTASKTVLTKAQFGEGA